MTSVRPLTVPDLINAEKKSNPNRLLSALMSALFGVATFLATFPQGGPGVLIGLGVIFVVIVAWWWRQRSHGMRFNNYDPMKTDAELARTPNSSPEQQRLMFLQIFVLAVVFGSRMFSFPGYPLIAGVTVTIASFVLLVVWGGLPASYEKISDLTRNNPSLTLSRNKEWMLGFLYAHRISPGGYQWRSDALAAAAADYGFSAKSVKKTIGELVSAGQAATIRELRSTDGSITWITLTEQGHKDAITLLK